MNIPIFGPARLATIEWPMAARTRIPMPAGFITAVDTARRTKKWTKRELGRRSKVGSSSMTRLYKGQTSYQTMSRVCRSLGIPVPVLVFPDAPIARLQAVRDADRDRYELIVALLP
jgi:hypothetical protein